MGRTTFGVATGMNLCVVWVAAASVTVAGKLAARQPADPSALILLDQYERGEQEDVVRALTALLKVDTPGTRRPEDRFSALGRDLDSVLPGWVEKADLTAQDRRRLVGSTLALEGAGTCATIRPQLQACLDWLNIGLRARNAHPLPEFDRDWYLAAMALVDGTRDPDVVRQFTGLANSVLDDQPELDLERAFAEELRRPDRRLSIGRSKDAKAVEPGTPLLTRQLPYRAPGSLPRFSVSSERPI
jgi:hypothetical protein